MVSTKKTLALIDEVLERKQDDGFRRHLGASVIGKKCSRELWYIFRWARRAQFKARILRLFSRGQDEEPRFVRWLEAAGIQVWTHTKDGEQYHVSDIDGHFGGSLDGVLRGLPDLPAQLCLAEFKTHNEKSFKDLLSKKLKKAKWEHYVQCQIYMFKRDLKWTLYCAVNKNTDDLYLEIIRLDEEVAKKHLERARFVIYTDEPPPRIHTNPRWHECLMCSYHKVCQGFELPAINCRTCAHSTPIEHRGAWNCALGQTAIDTAPKEGCSEHVFNPHILNGVQMGDGNQKENWVDLVMPNGVAIRHGPRYIPSHGLGKVYKRCP